MKHLILIILTPMSLFSQNNVCFNITSNPNQNNPSLAPFTKHINVLDCFEIYAEETISDTKVLHAAAIAAELLDNNEDGIVDDPLIKNELIKNQALIPIFFSDGNSAMDIFETYYNGNGVSAVLYNNEINPLEPGLWGIDATVEEILHTINHIGHTNAYPNAFNITPNSSLMTTAMDVARGGQFLNVPNQYPNNAWYHYDDWTCNYECMAIEYMYWSIVSWMGLLNNPNICAGISNEWELCSPTLFQETDNLMFELITNTTYKLPLLAPDGNYCPEQTGFPEELKDSKKIIKITNLLGIETTVKNNIPLLYLFSNGDVEKKIILE